jgi:nucleotide-binding universal stress UspA family protein
MNKVIAALDSLNVSESTTDYAVYLSKEFNSHIVAAFLEDIIYHGKPDTDLWQSYEKNDWAGIETAKEKEELTRLASETRVKKKFNAEGVHYNVHKDPQIALQSLIHESHFADMILIDANESFSCFDASRPSYFIKDVLADADCPVMLVPNEFKPIEKFVFAYDGSSSSSYAIRMFTYIFSTIKAQEIEILMVNEDKHSNHLPEHHLLKELLKRKYSYVKQSLLKSEQAIDLMIDYLQTESKSSMVILGAYQRSSFSRWLRQSTADALISSLNMPLFIAHK